MFVLFEVVYYNHDGDEKDGDDDGGDHIGDVSVNDDDDDDDDNDDDNNDNISIEIAGHQLVTCAGKNGSVSVPNVLDISLLLLSYSSTEVSRPDSFKLPKQRCSKVLLHSDASGLQFLRQQFAGTFGVFVVAIVNT